LTKFNNLAKKHFQMATKSGFFGFLVATCQQLIIIIIIKPGFSFGFQLVAKNVKEY
jgi:hypothetical protein